MYMHVRTYVCIVDVPAVSVYISAVYMPKTSPLTPFVVYISVFSFLSLPLPFFFLSFSLVRFLALSLFLSFFLAGSHPPRATIHLSLGLIYDGETRNRVGNNVPGKKLRKEENFLVLVPFFFALTRSLVRPFLSRRISPFYFACLCREKDSAGVSFLAGYREATGGRPETARGLVKKRDREEEREMIIHSAVITQSPAP